MKFFHFVITVVVLASGTMTVMAQNRVARTPSATGQNAGGNISQAQAAIDQAAAAQKYAFIFFWKEKNAQTDKAWNSFQQSAARLADSADVVSVQVTNPNEKQIVDRYNVSRAPMPLVLAVAPCGAITKGFNGVIDEKQLRTAIVSQCTQLCLKALQERKLVLVCIMDQTTPQDPAMIPKGVKDFKADAKVGPATEVVLVNAHDDSEAAFLKDFQVNQNTPKPAVVFLAPPGSMIGKFNGTVTKQQLMAQLVSAQSNPCAGGKCGPNGCGPKK
jgi:hypothetical protein